MFCIKKWASVLVTMSVKKFHIANWSAFSVVNCNILRCTTNIFNEYVEHSTFSFSHSVGYVVVFYIYGCSTALELATIHFVRKHRKLNWNETISCIFDKAKLHVTITTLYYYSIVADVKCCAVLSAHCTQCRSVAFHYIYSYQFIIVGILVFGFCLSNWKALNVFISQDWIRFENTLVKIIEKETQQNFVSKLFSVPAKHWIGVWRNSNIICIWVWLWVCNIFISLPKGSWFFWSSDWLLREKPWNWIIITTN